MAALDAAASDSDLESDFRASLRRWGGKDRAQRSWAQHWQWHPRVIRYASANLWPRRTPERIARLQREHCPSAAEERRRCHPDDAESGWFWNPVEQRLDHG